MRVRFVKTATVRVVGTAKSARTELPLEATVDPNQLEALRNSLDLRVDRNGRLLHDNEPIAHRGVRAVLQGGLELLADGRAVVRLGEQIAYVRFEITPFVVTRTQLTATGLQIRLNTGRSESVAAVALQLRLVGASTLLIQLPQCGLLARFGSAAWSLVGEQIVAVDGGYALITADWRATVRSGSSSENGVE